MLPQLTFLRRSVGCICVGETGTGLITGIFLWRKYLKYQNYDLLSFDQILLQIVMRARPSILLFESANPRHAHEVDIFKSLKEQIPEDKVLVPGVIDSTTNFIEHPQLVAKRLLEFSSIVGKERYF